jgi:hypothetical protein
LKLLCRLVDHGHTATQELLVDLVTQLLIVEAAAPGADVELDDARVHPLRQVLDKVGARPHLAHHEHHLGCGVVDERRQAVRHGADVVLTRCLCGPLRVTVSGCLRTGRLVHRIPFALNGVRYDVALAVQGDVSTGVVHGDHDVARMFFTVLDDRNDVGQR